MFETIITCFVVISNPLVEYCSMWGLSKPLPRNEETVEKMRDVCETIATELKKRGLYLTKCEEYRGKEEIESIKSIENIRT